MNPFDFLNSINQTKNSIIDADPETERQYNPFLANRGLSYFSDTIFLANEMNRLPGLGKKLQYDFLLQSVRPRKRFSKWLKDESNERIDALKTLYGYSHAKAKQAIHLISEDDWKYIMDLANPDKNKNP
jgi:hypothetical protein